MKVQLYSTPQTSSQWLCIRSQDLHNQLTPVLNEVNHQFTNVNKIPGWKLNDVSKSHITLYMGWNSVLDQNEQRELLEKIMAVINRRNFIINLTPNNTLLHISNYYVELRISDPKLSKLQKTIQTVAEDFIIEKGIDKNGKWFNKNYNTHITLGHIDNISRTGNNKLIGKFKNTWKDNVLNQHFTSPATQKITSIDLLGINDPSLAREEKEYYLLGEIQLNPYSKNDLKRRLTNITNNVNSLKKVEVKNTSNPRSNKNEVLIEVSFDNQSDADTILEKANLGNAVFKNNNLYTIRLGKKRLENLFPNEGEVIYSDLTNT